MAKVWFARDGENPTGAEPRYDRPLQECARQLGRAQRLCGLDQRPVIGEESPLSQYYQYVICWVDHQEAFAQGWKAGYYLLEISPKEVAKRLGPPGVG